MPSIDDIIKMANDMGVKVSSNRESSLYTMNKNNEEKPSSIEWLFEDLDLDENKFIYTVKSDWNQLYDDEYNIGNVHKSVNEVFLDENISKSA